MANDPTIQNVDANNMMVDSKIPLYVSGDTIDTLTCITDSPCMIKYIYWYNPTSAAHLAALKDADGNMLFPLYAIIAHQGVTSGKIELPAPNGIYMDDLDSGAILIITTSL